MCFNLSLLIWICVCLLCWVLIMCLYLCASLQAGQVQDPSDLSDPLGGVRGARVCLPVSFCLHCHAFLSGGGQRGSLSYSVYHPWVFQPWRMGVICFIRTHGSSHRNKHCNMQTVMHRWFLHSTVTYLNFTWNPRESQFSNSSLLFLVPLMRPSDQIYFF